MILKSRQSGSMGCLFSVWHVYVYDVVPVYLICIQNSVSSHSFYCMLTLILQRMLSFDNH
jgi:hypothetical protein